MVFIKRIYDDDDDDDDVKCDVNAQTEQLRITFTNTRFFSQSTGAASTEVLRGCQTIDEVGQLSWAWFKCQRKSADGIVEPRHTSLVTSRQ